MDIEEKIFLRNFKGIEKDLEMSRFGIVEYSIRSESRHMIALWDQTCYVPRSPKDLRILYPKGI